MAIKKRSPRMRKLITQNDVVVESQRIYNQFNRCQLTPDEFERMNNSLAAHSIFLDRAKND